MDKNTLTRRKWLAATAAGFAGSVCTAPLSAQLPPLVLATFLMVLPNGPDSATSELSEEEAKEGFVSIFDGKTLDGWQGDTAGYEAKEGVLVCTKRGRGLQTQKQYGNFVLRFYYKLQPGGNNGVDIRGMEIQILDDDAPKHAHLKPCQYHGSVYCRVAAKRGHQKPLGEWNEQEILVDGKHVKVTLNGVAIVDAETDHPALNRPKGPIRFKGHHEHVEFCNLRIKELPE
jgi:hypothetical protein